MRKYILIIISIILMVLLLVIYFQKSPSNKQYSHTEVAHPNTALQSEVKPILQSKTSHPKQIEKKSVKKTETSKKSPSNKPFSHARILYKTLPLEEAHMISKQKRHITPVVAIHLDASTFENIQKGETLTLPDIEGLDYTLTVIDVQTYANGASSTTANYVDEGVTYTTTITHSKSETFITLATAQGLYEIETKQGTGYVYDSSNIRKQMQRPNTNDVIVLPVPKQ